MKPLLVTYPRSGQHYLVDLLKQQLDLTIDFDHEPVINGYDTYITVVRKPIDCMTSWIVMEVECGPIQFSKEYPIEQYVKEAIKKYILFYTYALKKVNIFIDYNNLINDTDKVINLLSTQLNMPIISKEYTSTVKDNRSGRFLKTCVTSDLYSIAKELLLKEDLTLCESLYAQAIDKCAIV